MSRKPPRTPALGRDPMQALYGTSRALTPENNATARVLKQGNSVHATVTRGKAERVVWVLMYAGKPKYATVDRNTRDSWVRAEHLWETDRYQLVEISFLV